MAIVTREWKHPLSSTFLQGQQELMNDYLTASYILHGIADGQEYSWGAFVKYAFLARPTLDFRKLKERITAREVDAWLEACELFHNGMVQLQATTHLQ